MMKTMKTMKPMKPTAFPAIRYLRHAAAAAALALVLAPPAPAQTTVLDGLVGYWQFENDYTDSAGANDMEVGAGAPTFGTGADAQVGTYALNVDSSSHAVTQANIDAAVTGTSSRTLSLWFKQDSGNGNQSTVSWGGRSGLGTLFENLLHSGKSCGHWWEAGYDNLGNAPAYSAETWTHFAMSWDGTTARIYQDGVHISAADWSAGALNTTPTPLYAGGGNATTGSVFDFDQFAGAIDDVAVWNRVLDNDEVQSIYDYGVQGLDLYAIPEPSGALLLGAAFGLAALAHRRRR